MPAGIIRPATSDDSLGLARVHVAAWRSTYAEIVPRSFLERVTESSREKQLRSALEARRECTAVWEDGAIRGFVTYGACRDADEDPHLGEIWGIYVHPARWRHGIGTALMTHSLQELRCAGCKSAVIWVLDENVQACRFYERLGFMRDGRRKEIDLDYPLQAVRYARSMAAC